MRTFIMLYMTDRSQRAERDAFVQLASVCWNWRQTLVGWLESPTRHWLKHQLKKLIEREYTVQVHRHTPLLGGQLCALDM